LRLVSVDKLEPGLVMGRAVVDENGKILLNQNVVLTEQYIRALRAKGYETVYIKGPDDPDDLLPDEDLDPTIRAEAIVSLRNVFDKIEHQVREIRHQSFDDLARSCSSDAMRALMAKGGPFEDIHKVVTHILQDVLTRSTLAGLTSMKSSLSRLYDHCIDVCVVAIMIGRALGLDEVRMRQLATGCLLHDIGKVFLPPTLDETRLLRQHTLLGHELLRNSEDGDILAPRVALEHHEHQDGSGEPRGLIGSNQIERDRAASGPVPTLIGEIAAVANVYDNLLTGTAGRPPMPPDAAIQTVRTSAGTLLNQAVVNAFLRVTPVYPLGTEVLVREGDYRNFTGLVVEVHPDQLDKPRLLLIRDSKWASIQPVDLDLLFAQDVKIRTKTT